MPVNLRAPEPPLRYERDNEASFRMAVEQAFGQFTAQLNWDAILGKPSTFPPEAHAIDGAAHTGNLPAARVSAGTFGAGDYTFPDVLVLARAGAGWIVRPDATTALSISGSTNTGAGANYHLFGQSHGSLPSVHQWRQATTERMRLTDRLLIGTTDNGNAAAGGLRTTGAVDIGGDLYLGGTLQTGTVPAARVAAGVFGTGQFTFTAAASGIALRLHRAGGQPSMKAVTDGYMIIDSNGQYLSLNHYVSDAVVLVNGGGNVGIGTASPSSKLHLVGSGLITGNLTVESFLTSAIGRSLDTSPNSSGSIIAYPGGGSLRSASSTQAGAIKIRLPFVGWPNTMLRLRVEFYRYSGGASATMYIEGYPYSSASTWANTGAMTLSPDSLDPVVRFGHDGTNPCIWIGETGSSWSYPYVRIVEVSASHNNSAQHIWRSGWEMSFVTSFDTVQVTQSNNKPVTPASKVSAGTFGAGDYTFPNVVTVLGGESSALTNPGQIAVKRSGSNAPYISFHGTNGTRGGYIQFSSTGQATLSVDVNQDLRIRTNNTEAAYFRNSGQLVLGNSNAVGNAAAGGLRATGRSQFDDRVDIEGHRAARVIASTSDPSGTPPDGVFWAKV
jgi:hypothetical protein